MAAIGSIRKHSTFLVIVIGVALAAFVLGDFAKRRQRRNVNVGKVNGEQITIMDFNNKVDQNIEATKQQQQKNNLDQNETFRLRNQTWDQMVREILMNDEFDELGIDVSADELTDLILGTDPHPLIKKYFVNPQTGTFDRQIVINFKNNLDKMTAEQQSQWDNLVLYIKNDRKQQKYDALISKGYYVPTALAKLNYSEENDKANLEFAAVRYSDVADSLVKPTDEDYQRYYDEHKEQYKQEKSRSIDFVIFDVKPSKKDAQKALKEAIATKEDFEKTGDVAQFVKANSDAPYDSSWKAKGELPVQIDSIMFNSKPGTIVGPYKEGDSYNIARLVDVGYRPDSLKASHILIAYKGAMRANPNLNRTKEEAKQLADSLFNVLKKHPGKLETLADEFSDDGSVNQNHGDLGWFLDGRMVPAFTQAVINTKTGHFTIAETPFGYHVIKVTGKTKPVKKVRVAIIKQEIVPSNETYQNIFAKASKLATENKTADAFYKAILKEHLHKRTMPRIHEMSNYITGLNNPRQVVKWAFNEDTEIGDVSEVFDLDGQYVVAVLTEKYEEGYPSLDEVKQRIATNVLNQVKGRYLAEKMKAYNGNLDKIAKEMNGIKESVPALAFTDRNMPKFGREKMVIGYTFGMDDNKTSKPLIGNGGTFVIKLNKITHVNPLSDYTPVVKKMEENFAKRVKQDRPYWAIKKAADIVDNRISFY
jgi:peptidyl-prolyl cis-trans isomerase D